MSVVMNPVIESIADIIKKFLVQGVDDRFEHTGREFLRGKIAFYVSRMQPLRFVLPGFPCKSPNHKDKTFGVSPDYGDFIALKHIDAFAREIEAVYGPGCQVVVLSDGTTFNDIVGVSDEARRNYNDELRGLYPSSAIEWRALDDFFPDAKDADGVRSELIKKANLPCKTVSDLARRVKSDASLGAVHDKLCNYLYNDIKLNRESDQSEDAYLASVSEKAYQMMYRGRVLNALVESAFPDEIRLSVHQYSNEGPKFTFSFLPEAKTVVQPWHSVPVITRSGQVSLVSNASVQQDRHALVTFNERPWAYVEVENVEASTFGYRLMKKPTFGLEVTDRTGVGLQALSPAFLSFLSYQFGFLCIKGVDFQEQQELTQFCQDFGDIYLWKFGAVHVVKPDEKPEGFVHSLEKTPMHWDLSMLPLQHEQVKSNEWFSASKFMLYCKTPPVKGEGCTIVVDGRIVLDMAGPKTVSQWDSTQVTYDTRMTYFGGCPRTYPLTHKHPESGEKVFRYQEGSDSDLQKFSVKVEGCSESQSRETVVGIDQLIYDERCMIAHEWEAGDLLMVDNWLMLHGRSPMSERSRSRELWRVQVY